MNKKAIKVLGFAATIIGLGVGLLTDWVNEKKMDEMVEEKVNEALAERENDENENEDEEI